MTVDPQTIAESLRAVGVFAAGALVAGMLFMLGRVFELVEQRNQADRQLRRLGETGVSRTHTRVYRGPRRTAR